MNSERLGGSLLEGDPRVVHQHVDPSVSEAGLVLQGGFANYVSCFVGYHTNVERNRSLPLLDGVPQGLNSGKVSKVTEVEFWREPLCFKARHCCLLKIEFRI